MSGPDAAQGEAWERAMERGRAACGCAAGAARPLRIAVLGWAWPSRQAAEGSGLNLSVSELMAALAARGHRVMYLRSGMDYSLRPGMWIELTEVWRGVGSFRLFNSPNLATGNYNFHNMREQICSARHTAMVVEWARAVRADVVHVHSFEGFGFDVVGALRGAGLPVAVTPHNYFAICPQVDLLRREERTCADNEGGLACVGCLSHAPDVKAFRWWRRRNQTMERWLGGGAPIEIRDRLRRARETVRVRLTRDRAEVPVLSPGVRAAWMPPPMPVADADENERVLRRREPEARNEYGERRIAGIGALNASSAVLCPSRFLMAVHAAHGVNEGVLRHVALGQPHFDELRGAAEASPYYRLRPWSPEAGRPLRLAYFGNCHPNKGLATLVRALAEMPEELAGRVHCAIRASGDDRPLRAMLAGRSHASFLGAYDVSELGAAMREFEVCVFPNMGLENSPLVVLEALHAGKFVIASRLGGGMDWIEEGRNGLLFRAGHVGELIERVRDVADGRVALPSAAEVHACSRLRSHGAYVDEVSGILEELAAGPQRSGAGA